MLDDDFKTVIISSMSTTSDSDSVSSGGWNLDDYEREIPSFPVSLSLIKSEIVHPKKKSSTSLVNKKRKLEDNPRAHLYLPRIPRSDIRRQYATMFSNVYNSCDADFMGTYLQTFFVPDAACIFRKEVGAVRKEAECHGREKLQQMWIESTSDTPDLVFTLGKTQIKVRSDGTGVVSSSFYMTGTKILGNEAKNVAMQELHNQFQDDDDDCLPVFQQQTQQQQQAALLAAAMAAQQPQLNFEDEFNKALEEYLEDGEDLDEMNDIDTMIHTTSRPTATIPSTAEMVQFDGKSPCPFGGGDNTIFIENNVLSCKFVLDGHLALHLDADSKVYLITYTIYSGAS